MKWLKVVLLGLVPICVLVAIIGFILGMSYSWNGKWKFNWFACFPAGIWGVVFLAAIYFCAEEIKKTLQEDKPEKKAEPQVKHIHVFGEKRAESDLEKMGEEILTEARSIRNATLLQKDPQA